MYACAWVFASMCVCACVWADGHTTFLVIIRVLYFFVCFWPLAHSLCLCIWLAPNWDSGSSCCCSFRWPGQEDGNNWRTVWHPALPPPILSTALLINECIHEYFSGAYLNLKTTLGSLWLRGTGRQAGSSGSLILEMSRYGYINTVQTFPDKENFYFCFSLQPFVVPIS